MYLLLFISFYFIAALNYFLQKLLESSLWHNIFISEI
jgi:hypothetical protein